MYKDRTVHLVFPNLKLSIVAINDNLILTGNCAMAIDSIYSLGWIVIESALHHHRLNLVLFRSIHSRDIMINALSRLVLGSSLNRTLSLFPCFLVLITYRYACNNQARILRNETLLIDILLFRLCIRYLEERN